MKKLQKKYTHTREWYKRKQKHRTNPFLRLAIIAFAFFIVYSLKSAIEIPSQPLSTLHVPNTPETMFTSPLTLSTVNTNVLGAETIDPTDFISEINNERERYGSPPLRMNLTLMKAAQMRAEVILKHENFSHQDPYEHIELLTVLPSLGYTFRYASENIGMGGVSAKDFVNGFMHSTLHRENLLNDVLQDTGAAIVTGKYQQYYVNIAVQIFTIPGGKYETLGYTPENIKQFSEALQDVSTRLAKAQILLYVNWFGKRNEYQEWITLLLRQKEILETIYPLMEKEEPLSSNLVQLIVEYNRNASKAPQSPPT